MIEPANTKTTAVASANFGRKAHAASAAIHPRSVAAGASLSSMRRQTPSWKRGGNDGVARASHRSALRRSSLALGFSGFMDGQGGGCLPPPAVYRFYL